MQKLIGVAVILASSAMGAELVPGDVMSLCREGDGQWDVKVKRGQDGPYEIVYGMPRGRCIDNRGRIYVCDTFANRILCFGSDGRPLSEITHPDLYHPTAIEVDSENVLLVTGISPGEKVQFEVDVSDTIPAFTRLEDYEVLAEDNNSYSGPTTPFGSNGLRYINETVGVNQRLVLINRANQYVKSVPSRFVDRQGRYYESVRQEIDEKDYPMGVFDESGNLRGRFTAPSMGFVKLNGWIYFIDPSEDGEPSTLKRYASNGAVEHAVTLVDYERPTYFLTSPDGNHILWFRSEFVQGVYQVTARWYVYHRDEN